MSDDICWLISVLYKDQLLKFAVKLKGDMLSDDCFEHYMESENKEQIRLLLPAHVRDYKILDIMPLFDVFIL